jgi:hypothetical protein
MNQWRRALGSSSFAPYGKNTQKQRQAGGSSSSSITTWAKKGKDDKEP